jgi:hypothetical protein
VELIEPWAGLRDPPNIVCSTPPLSELPSRRSSFPPTAEALLSSLKLRVTLSFLSNCPVKLLAPGTWVAFSLEGLLASLELKSAFFVRRGGAGDWVVSGEWHRGRKTGAC